MYSTALILHVYLQIAFLAGFAFFVSWIMTGKFEDDFARLVYSTSLASWVAVASGITGFILFQLEQCALGRDDRSPPNVVSLGRDRRPEAARGSHPRSDRGPEEPP